MPDAGFGRGARPVIFVSWNEAEAYAEWLAKISGKRYRLLSEAEWEYAARAGTSTAYPWGENPDQACAFANVADATVNAQVSIDWPWALHNCSDGYAYTAPAGSYRPNEFGLYDMIGNVWERPQDCYHGSYGGAPEDGSAWRGGQCDQYVMRGGSWVSNPRSARPAARLRNDPGERSRSLGFRLARTLR